MMSEWIEYSLGDLGVIKTGKTPPSKVEEAYGGNIPFITPSDMDGRKWVNTTERYLSNSGLDSVKNSFVPARSVAVSCIGSDMGKAVMVSRPSVTNQQINTIIVDEERFNAEFVYYILSTRQDELKSIASGSATPILNKRHFSNVKLFIPSKIEQDSIVDILRSIDDKIELNRQINQTLEQIAQAIFKSWFVDFDPVKAKIAAKQNGLDIERAAMCAISGKTDEELDQLSPEQRQQLATTAALFPDELVNLDIGEIPKGWEYGTLSEICTFTSERIDVAELILENYISTENMLEGRKGITTASSLPAVQTVPRFRKGQVLVSNIRPYFKKIWLSRFEGGRSNDVLCFKTTDSDSVEFLYNLLYQNVFFNFMLATSKGAKMPRGDKDAIMGWNIPKPTLETRQAYSTVVKNYYKIIESLNKENQYLSNLRDFLLPKLLSGEITLCDSQSIAEAVA
jgi:type I restriction enzyme, S subunit